MDSYRQPGDLHQQWGGVEPLQLVENQVHHSILDHLKQLHHTHRPTPDKDFAVVNAEDHHGFYQQLWACWVRYRLILLLLNKARWPDRETGTTQSGKSQLIINQDSQDFNSLGRSQRPGGNVEDSVVINGLVGQENQELFFLTCFTKVKMEVEVVYPCRCVGETFEDLP